jgi:stage V sporulation protein B
MGVAAIINLFFIYHYIGYRMEIPQLVKTMISAGAMAIAVKLFYDGTMAAWSLNAVSTFGAVLAGCIVYIAAMLLIGGIMEEDMERIPLLGRVSIRFLRRIGVFKDEDKA